MTAQTAVLREMLERRFPDAVPVAMRAARALPTGVAALDGILPGGGLPRGRLSVWAPGVGSTAILRAACLETVGRGERAAWVDAAGTISGLEPWGGIVLLRPAERREALVAAEELVRCGAFALVVLSGAATAGTERARLCRTAKEGGTTLVETSTEGFMAAVRLSSHPSPWGWRWQRDALGEAVEVECVRVRVRAAALGWSQEAEIELPVLACEQRLSLESAMGDRRGAAH